MKWRKLGLVYCPDGSAWWQKNGYATVPTADVLGDTIRVYWASLDENNYGRIGYCDVSADDPTKVLYVTPEPIMDIGGPGRFDDSGVNPSCVVQDGDGRKLMYFIGWQRMARVPYTIYAGLAIVGDGYVTRYEVPILDRTPNEQLIRSALTVLHTGFERWEGWYPGSDGAWIEVRGKTQPVYTIRHTISHDGLRWGCGKVALQLREGEFGLGRPWVVRDGDLWRMWYSRRTYALPYRMGYAESEDGERWTRKDDEVGLDVSETGWDSESVEYACVVDAGGKRLMFYNGNQHGKTGFGVAVLE